MFDALSFAEIDGQHAELLPARTVLSLFSAGGGGESHCNQVGVVNLAGTQVLNNVLNVIPILSPISATAC